MPQNMDTKDEEGTITLVARCLCGTHSYSASLLAESPLLPLQAVSCHCDSCRHLTGSLYSVCCAWPNQAQDLSGLERYVYSDRYEMLSCGKCSSRLFGRTRSEAEGKGERRFLGVVTAALENAGALKGRVRFAKHLFVGDTKDGGASGWLLHASGAAITGERWSGHAGTSEKLGEEWPEEAQNSAEEGQRESQGLIRALAQPDLTPLSCHCGGVRLALRSATDLAALPDERRPWSVDPETGNYSASMCGCDSCRLAVGTDIVFWTFVPVARICFEESAAAEATSNLTSTSTPSPWSSQPGFATTPELREAVDRGDARLGTLRKFQSSPGVVRYACGTCAASIFYADERNPEQVDVAVGVLRHPDGARADGLLTWELGKVDWEVDGKGGWREEFLASVRKGSEEWRVKKGLPVDFVRARREKEENENSQRAA